MKKTHVDLWLVIGLVIVSAYSAVQAAEIDVAGEAELAVNSAFVWRGQVINDEPVINPYLALHTMGWKLSTWGSWDLTSVENSSDHSRVDATLEYAGEWKRQIFSAGSVAYIYGDSRDTYEVFAGYKVDVPTLPALTVYYDFGEIEGFYASFSLAHSFLLVEDTLALDLGVSIGGANEDYAAAVFTLDSNASSGFPGFAPEGESALDFNATVDLPIELGEQFTLMPGVRYMRVVDSHIQDALDTAGMEYEQYMWGLRGTYYF